MINHKNLPSHLFLQNSYTNSSFSLKKNHEVFNSLEFSKEGKKLLPIMQQMSDWGEKFDI